MPGSGTDGPSSRRNWTAGLKKKKKDKKMKGRKETMLIIKAGCEQFVADGAL